MRKIMNQRRGFTLIELSVVLIVIALLVGGVVVGQDLIGGARIQNIIAEKEGFVSAFNQFKDKYKGLPGDLYNATSYWDTATTGVIDGSGNGTVADILSGEDDEREAFQAWKQLALAGFIDGDYTGVAGQIDPGVNVPKASYNDVTGWQVTYFPAFPVGAFAEVFGGKMGHIFYLGRGEFFVSSEDTGTMKTEDIVALELKADDGFPGTGNIRSGTNSGDEVYGGACVSGDDPTTATYVPDQTTCIPLFLTDIN